jgi:DNA mismatch endonuclease (patch repair protein)
MQIIGRREPKAETQLRSLLHSSGLRFRKNLRPTPDLSCTADIVFPKARVSVFVDGCFWHGCPLHFKVPSSHSQWWAEKVADNRARDKRQTQALDARGWLVIRVWEHEDLAAAADQIRALVLARRARNP